MRARCPQTSLPRRGDHVFPSPRKRDAPYRELRRPWNHVREKAGLLDVQLKDFRHTHASVAAQCGFSLPVIGKLLGHTQPATTARYAHLAADPMHEAAERIGMELAAAMNGNEKAPILELRRQRG